MAINEWEKCYGSGRHRKSPPRRRRKSPPRRRRKSPSRRRRKSPSRRRRKSPSRRPKKSSSRRRRKSKSRRRRKSKSRRRRKSSRMEDIIERRIEPDYNAILKEMLGNDIPDKNIKDYLNCLDEETKKKIARLHPGTYEYLDERRILRTLLKDN